MTGLIGLDFETYGAVDLRKHGLHRYIGDKTFQPLIASVVWNDGHRLLRHRLDLTDNIGSAKMELASMIGGSSIVAHNAPFEEQVLHWLGLEFPSRRFIDSAVLSSAAGAGRHLEAAAPQLLNVDKMASGSNLIKVFSVPGEYQERNGNLFFDRKIIFDRAVEWNTFGEYCDLDAELGLRIVEMYGHYVHANEMAYAAITMQMNRKGWPVDLPLVEEMNRRYLENQMVAEQEFAAAYADSKDLNLRSLKQLKEWCLNRGIKANSFDEKHVASLLERIEKKLQFGGLDPVKAKGYAEVCHLLRTKQVLGGSSLKKLQVILDTAVTDDNGVVRLKDQYVHCGAGQTLRTSGRSVQMQNLKRLSVVGDMDELDDPNIEWDNSKMAENLRQTFCSSDKNGQLVVGDFKSIESRGLAYMAGESWKLNAYAGGDDLYKVLAARIKGIHIDSVTADDRQFGKVGELSCGYGAGGGAVQAFASNMGVTLSEGEANKLVYDWRSANPRTVEFWDELNDMLHQVVESGSQIQRLQMGGGLELSLRPKATPQSLLDQHYKARSVEMAVNDMNGYLRLVRYFHGCYVRGGNIAYYRPSDRKTGDLWRNTFTDPKTKKLRYYELYGGKLAGILTQSFCREIFMHVLNEVNNWWRGASVDVVGQFHDEIVLDWRPGGIPLLDAKMRLQTLMSTQPRWLPGFPLDADVKSGYRYIK